MFHRKNEYSGVNSTKEKPVLQENVAPIHYPSNPEHKPVGSEEGTTHESVLSPLCVRATFADRPLFLHS